MKFSSVFRVVLCSVAICAGALAQTSVAPAGFLLFSSYGNTPTIGHCIQILGVNSSGVTAQDAGAACGGSGGSPAFNNILSGTNVSAAMLVGSGSSLGTTGTGSITASAAPLSGLTGLGSNVSTFLATPSSANLAAALTNETGSGLAVFNSSPTLVTPVLGAATATSINGTPIPSSVTLPSISGTPTSGHCVNWATSSTLGDAGSACGSGGGSSAFASLTSGTNVTAAMLVGSGASLGPTGTGTLTANALASGIALGTPASGVLTNATGLPLTTGVTGVLLVANGGTGTATPSLVAGSNITITGSWPNQTITGSASGGGVTSFASSNGFAGTIASNVATLSTSITGPLKGNGTALQAAAASDIVNLFTGGATCSSTTVLLGNGQCGSGTPIPSLPSYASPVSADLMIVYSQANSAAEQSTIGVLQAEFLALGLRIQTAATSTTITPTVGTADQVNQANTQATGTLTIANPTGTPTDGQRLTIRLTSTNVQTFAWGTAYHGSTTAALPAASTGGGKHDYLGFIYDAATSQWDYVSSVTGF